MVELVALFSDDIGAENLLNTFANSQDGECIIQNGYEFGFGFEKVVVRPPKAL